MLAPCGAVVGGGEGVPAGMAGHVDVTLERRSWAQGRRLAVRDQRRLRPRSRRRLAPGGREGPRGGGRGADADVHVRSIDAVVAVVIPDDRRERGRAQWRRRRRHEAREGVAREAARPDRGLTGRPHVRWPVAESGATGGSLIRAHMGLGSAGGQLWRVLLVVDPQGRPRACACLSCLLQCGEARNQNAWAVDPSLGRIPTTHGQDCTV